MSKLRAYLDRHDIRQADFAGRIGSTQGMVSRLITGAVLPSLKMAIAIERETGGEVPANSWGDVSAPSPTPDEDAA